VSLVGHCHQPFSWRSRERAVNQDIWVGGHRYISSACSSLWANSRHLARQSRLHSFRYLQEAFGIDFSGQAFSPSGVRRFHSDAK
jgi:hypothetical protein